MRLDKQLNNNNSNVTLCLEIPGRHLCKSTLTKFMVLHGHLKWSAERQLSVLKLTFDVSFLCCRNVRETWLFPWSYYTLTVRVNWFFLWPLTWQTNVKNVKEFLNLYVHITASRQEIQFISWKYSNKCWNVNLKLSRSPTYQRRVKRQVRRKALLYVKK